MQIANIKNIKFNDYKKIINNFTKVLNNVYFSIDIKVNKNVSDNYYNIIIILYTDNNDMQKLDLNTYNHTNFNSLEELNAELLSNIPNYKSIYDNNKATK